MTSAPLFGLVNRIKMFPNIIVYVLLLSSCSAMRQLWTERDPKSNGREISVLGADGLVIAVEHILSDEGTKTEIPDISFDGYSGGERKKRSLYILSGRAVRKGIQALKLLLNGATETQKNVGRLYYREFTKNGGYKQTLKDFASVSPTNIRPFQQPSGVPGVVGIVGDRKIYMQSGGATGRPTLTVMKDQPVEGGYSEAVVQKITYFD